MTGVELLGPGWVRSGAASVRGHAHVGGRCMDAAGLASAFNDCTTDAAWSALLGSLNGNFAVVTTRNGILRAAVDRVRSMPLFYAFDGDGIALSDDAYRVVPDPATDDSDSSTDLEFRLTGYVTGRQTLRAGVFQIEAGSVIEFDSAAPGQVRLERFHTFLHKEAFDGGPSRIISDLEDVHARVFRRLIASVDAKTIVVPLSGGYDSRLIGVALRDCGVRDVICYSYGVPGNWESRISRELAGYLGFRWEFIPYSAERWHQWAATERFANYFHAAGNLASVPHIQDWPAVLEMQREARIPPDSVFVPGHSGDFLAGSHIPKSFGQRSEMSRREILDSIEAAHYSLWEWPRETNRDLQDLFDRRIEAVVGGVADSSSPADAASIFEQWDLQERQAKFICNSVRVYEDFGYEWRLPLFDHELMDFWARVPFGHRLGRSLYFEFVRQRQQLPITAANSDHGMIVTMLIRGLDHVGLRPLARRGLRTLRRLRWRRSYTGSSLAWLELVEREHFRRTYTGKELMHSYLAERYRGHLDAPK